MPLSLAAQGFCFEEGIEITGQPIDFPGPPDSPHSIRNFGGIRLELAEPHTLQLSPKREYDRHEQWTWRRLASEQLLDDPARSALLCHAFHGLKTGAMGLASGQQPYQCRSS